MVTINVVVRAKTRSPELCVSPLMSLSFARVLSLLDSNRFSRFKQSDLINWIRELDEIKGSNHLDSSVNWSIRANEL